MNIWAPATATNVKLPVMVFFHGGAYKEGCDVGPFEIYAGTSLVNNKVNPVVVVTANYRLGPFGWLSNGKNIKGNYGLWDNIAALEFVRDNIEGFGGDKDRVTIWGESAGAENVGILLTSAYHAAEGLFHRAIMESNPAAFRLRGPLDNAVYAGAFCKALNCSGCALPCMQAKDQDEVRNAWGKAGNGIAPIVLGNWGHWLDALLAGGPVVDGDLIKAQPNAAVLPYYPGGFAGGNSNVSVLIGTNDNEGSTFIYAMGGTTVQELLWRPLVKVALEGIFGADNAERIIEWILDIQEFAAGGQGDEQVAESARALTVTFQVRRYRKHVNFGC